MLAHACVLPHLAFKDVGRYIGSSNLQSEQVPLRSVHWVVSFSVCLFFSQLTFWGLASGITCAFSVILRNHWLLQSHEDLLLNNWGGAYLFWFSDCVLLIWPVETVSPFDSHWSQLHDLPASVFNSFWVHLCRLCDRVPLLLIQGLSLWPSLLETHLLAQAGLKLMGNLLVSASQVPGLQAWTSALDWSAVFHMWFSVPQHHLFKKSRQVSSPLSIPGTWQLHWL